MLPPSSLVARLKGSRRAGGWRIFLWVPKHTSRLPPQPQNQPWHCSKIGKKLKLSECSFYIIFWQVRNCTEVVTKLNQVPKILQRSVTCFEKLQLFQETPRNSYWKRVKVITDTVLSCDCADILLSSLSDRKKMSSTITLSILNVFQYPIQWMIPLWSTGQDTCLTNRKAVVWTQCSANAFEPKDLNVISIPLLGARAVDRQLAMSCSEMRC